MANTKSSNKKPSAENADKKDVLLREYKKYVLLNGHDPESVFKFTYEHNMEEGEFYQYFSSFNAIKKYIWVDYFHKTQEALIADKAYARYGVREKLLAFYYTMIEVLKMDRSFVNYSFRTMEKPSTPNPALDDFKHQFKEYINALIGEGLETGEILKRPVIGDRYFDGVWVQLLFIINYWLKDDSTNFENTDAAVEKSVNVSFELMGKSTVDTIVDFAKFLLNTRK